MSVSPNLISLDSYLSLKEVTDMVKVGSSTLYRWMDKGDFPRPRQLGERCVRWTVADIKEWQESRQVVGALKKAS
ncbi:AlpA family phage regulatory protein [Rhizobium sp. UGM030330-04]|uniref:helix-turn-helix transcriptional regulator n=1 Tax=Rhizobium sp. UGM030330-04 TaxID=1378077 RepID=UPI000D80EF9D|nr:AlpA family phage regulatory protein [Rhizobium sp. UGM030330-04]PYG56643.1 AlpA family transcriptional regulator [Rhizobium sp. UGM030330-04]